jgi:hypothetical protein
MNKIAIIDINLDYNSYRNFEGNIQFLKVCGTSVTDIKRGDVKKGSISHGGDCLRYFSEGADKAADYFILLQSDEIGKRNVDDLITALDWCIENSISLISLSMGTIDYKDAAKLSPVVKHINEADICLVVAGNNEGLLSYPACLKQCVGVSVDSDETLKLSGFAYIENPFNGINVIVSPNILKGEAHSSNSMATAYFAGLLAKSLETEGLDFRHARDWIAKNSESLDLKDLYWYYKKNIKINYADDVILIAINSLGGLHTKDYCRKLQEAFLDNEYYCLTVFPKDKATDKTEFTKQVHQHSSDFSCSYSEYVELVIQLCQPNVVIVDFDKFQPANPDVILAESDAVPLAENTLAINILNHSPEETFKSIVRYFDD